MPSWILDQVYRQFQTINLVKMQVLTQAVEPGACVSDKPPAIVNAAGPEPISKIMSRSFLINCRDCREAREQIF